MSQRDFNLKLSQIIAESDLPDEQIVNSLVAQIRSMQLVDKPRKLPELQNGKAYEAIPVGMQIYVKCHYIDNQFYYLGKPVAVSTYRE